MIKELLPIFDNAYRFKVDYKLNTGLQEIALKHLGLDNMNQLRDRFEGQTYLNRFLTKSYAEFAVQKMLGLDFVSLEVKVNKNYKPELIIKGRKFEIVAASLEDYPLIPAGDYTDVMLAFVNISRKEVFVVGYQSIDKLNHVIERDNLSPIMSKGYIGVLKDFTLISTAENLDSL